MKKKVTIFTIICFILPVLSFVFISSSKTQAKESKPQEARYEVEITAPNKQSFPKKAKQALEDSLTSRWKAETPEGHKFYLPEYRMEKDWALVTIFYYEKNKVYRDEGDSPLSNAFMMILSKDAKGEWVSARADEYEANKVIENVPNQDLPPSTKEKILFRPSLELSNTQEKKIVKSATSTDYRLPWDNGINDFVITRVWHGNGSSSWGAPSMHAVDLARGGNADILSPVNGTVHAKCLNTGSNQKQGMLAIKREGSNDIINVWHLDRKSVPSDIKLGSVVSQGQYLGRMVEGTVYESSPCPLNSAGTHLHLVFPYKPFTIDGYQFHNNGNVKNLANNTNVSINSTKLISTNQKAGVCLPPTSGTWIITQDCTLSSTRALNGDLIINDGKSLTLMDNITLDMDLSRYKILIKQNAKLFLKNGAKVN